MRQVDTTNPKANGHSIALLGEDAAKRALDAAQNLRVYIVGMYHSHVSASWGSGDASETDYLHHIEIPLAGRREVVHGDRSLVLEPGHVYLLPGNTPVQRRADGPSEVLYLRVRFEWLPGVDPLAEDPGRTPRRIAALEPEVWGPWMEPGWCADVNNLLRLQTQVQWWVANGVPSLGDIIDRHQATHGRFEPVLRLVEKRLGADLRITDLAEAHGTTPHAFSLAFSASTGATPKEFLNRRLNQEAIRLVIATDLSIKEIAHQLRFSDEFYFSRFFKKLNGIAPTAYRQRFRGK